MDWNDFYWEWGFLLYLIPWLAIGVCAAVICHKHRLLSVSHKEYKRLGITSDGSSAMQDCLLIPLGPIALFLVFFTDFFTV